MTEEDHTDPCNLTEDVIGTSALTHNKDFSNTRPCFGHNSGMISTRKRLKRNILEEKQISEGIKQIDEKL
jgi:hypothetical protein